MSIIQSHVAQMKTTQPEEYTKLMQGYDTEEEMLKEVEEMASLAIKGSGRGVKIDAKN